MPADDRNALRLGLSQFRLLAGGVESAQDDACGPEAHAGRGLPPARWRSLGRRGSAAASRWRRRLFNSLRHSGDAAVRQIGGDEHD